MEINADEERYITLPKSACLGKMRGQIQIRPMTKLLSVTDRAKGLIDPVAARKMFRMERYLPSQEFSPYLDHFWIVEWDVRGQAPRVQRTLPYPCVNLVFDAGRTAVFGVVRGAFDYVIKDTGHVLGVRFRPGAFRALLGRSVSSITDKTIALSQVLACDDAIAERSVLTASGDAAMVAAAPTIAFMH